MSRSYTATPNRTQLQPSTPLDAEGSILCSGHKRRAPRRVSGPKTKNAGRAFFCCPLDQNDEKRCKFFKWEDALENTARPVATPPAPQTPSRAPPPPKDDIDWGQVDADELEREAIASTPGSSQASQASQSQGTPFQNRLSAIAADERERKRKREDDDTPKRAEDTPRRGIDNPFLSSPGVGAAGTSSQPYLSALETLNDLPDHIRRLERLLTAAEKAKEGFRRTIKQRDERIRELEEKLNDLEG